MIKKIFKTGLQALFSAAVLFLLLEAIFRLCGAPHGAHRYIESISIKEQLPWHKPKGEYRIFAYGESTLHGAQYYPYSSPVRWLEAYLKDFLPGRFVRMVNFARMGAGINFVYHSFSDTLDYKPDLVIFYAGHNVFLDRNKFHEVEVEKRSVGPIARELVKESRFIAAVYRWIIAIRLKIKASRFEDRIEEDLIEKQPSGIGSENATPRNGEIYHENIRFFKESLAEILALAAKKNIPVLILKPVCNLKDFPPLHSLHLKPLSSGQLKEWEDFYSAGAQAEARGDFQLALEAYLKAYRLDETYAELCFRLGRIYFKSGELEKSKKLFEEARDNDAIIFRATRDILLAIEETVKNLKDVLYLDTEKILVPEAPGGILGEPIIEDNVHFSIRGHALTGRAMAGAMAQKSWEAPGGEWRFSAEKSFEQMSRQLGIGEEVQFNADLQLVAYWGSRLNNRLLYARKALGIHPRHPRALRHLAWTYWLMGQKEDALGVYRDLERESPEGLKAAFTNHPDVEKLFKEKFGR